MFKGIMAILSSEHVHLAEEVLKGGAGAIQFRHKDFYDSTALEHAINLRILCRNYGVPLIINDRADIALLVEADGVHLGQTDLPIAAVRTLIGKERILGATASTIQEALRAESEGADYLGCGHIFHTPTKKKNYPPIGLEALNEICRRTSLPVIAIGGINLKNLEETIAAGADGVAIASAVSTHPEPAAFLRQCREVISKYRKKRYRHLPGLEKLRQASVAVVGAGGLGCAALQYLAAAGIGRLAVIDADSVDLSNLTRQVLYTFYDVGRKKAVAAAEHLRRLNPDVILMPMCTMLTEENARELLEGYDLVIDATDNGKARQAIDRSGKPFIYGAISGFHGQVALFNEQFRYHDLFHGIEENFPGCLPDEVLGPLPGVVGAMQAFEALKLILGVTETLEEKLCVLDSQTWKSKVYSRIPEKYESSNDALWIDLREPLDLQAPKNWLKIPFTYFENAIKALPDKPLILICEKGRRSAQLAADLRERLNRQDIYSLSSMQAFIAASRQEASIRNGDR